MLPGFLIRPPDILVWPFADWINWLFVFLKDDLGLIYVSRAFAAGVEWLLDVSGKPAVRAQPLAADRTDSLDGHRGNRRFCGLRSQGLEVGPPSGGTFVWIAVMGQWKWAMETLSVIVVAAPITVLLGLVMGIAAWRREWVEKALNPILNIAQSLPHFAYMIPVVVFIGVGPKAGQSSRSSLPCLR